MLTARGLTVRYPPARRRGTPSIALAGADLDVPDGEVVCVLGASGSGKSTLLRAVAGLEPLVAGSVRWDDEDLTHVPPHRRHFGLMFQDHALFPHRDVLGNVAFGPRMQGVGAQAAADRARDVLARVGLTGFETRAVHTLSGGEQQRVALARALAASPRLLLLDEPLGALDRALRERLMVELREILVREQVTALHVTHDQEEAFALADRVVLLADGRVEQVGTPEAVWRHPATEHAARFLGCTNVIDATRRDDGTWDSAWGRVTLPPGTPTPDGAEGRLATRPDAWRLDPEGPVAGRVRARTFRRDHLVLAVDAGPAGDLEVAVPLADAPRDASVVRLAVDGAAVVVVPRA